MNYYGHDKYVAGAGTTTTAGIAAGVAGLNLLANGNGLGGLFGGGNASKLQEQNSALLAEVGQLKAEKYSDTQDAKLYDAVRALEQKQSATETAVVCLQKELAAYEAGQREIQDLRQQLTDSKIGGVAKDLNCLAGKVETMGMTFANRCNGIDAVIAGFTKTVILGSAICDTDNCCGRTQ
jgi:hypothetical protein